MQLAPGERITVTVQANDHFGALDIVLTVEEGEVYSFFTNPDDKWKDLIIKRNAEGFNNPLVADNKKRISDAKVMELCGTIDENEENHFRIGVTRENVSIPKTGKLYFFANDHRADFAYRNNRGEMLVEVIRVS